MILANFIEEKEKKLVEQHLCNSADLVARQRVNLTLLSGVNSFLSCISSWIIFAFHKGSSLHPLCKLLLGCLTITDLCVCLISQPLTAIYWISVAQSTLECLSLSISVAHVLYNNLYIVWSVGLNSDCNKRGQASRSVIGTEIQNKL